jgi:serine O-acetyltransferase
MTSNFFEDLACYREGIAAQGFWALQIYRFGHRCLHIKIGWLRFLARFVHYVLLKFSEVFFGICIPPKIVIGRRLVIEHFGGIVLHGLTKIGDDCIIRQGVTIGNRYLDRPAEAPRIGNRVDIGAGAKILGPVTIGDDVSIGANAVVLVDVPSGCTAVGIPARVIRKKDHHS